MKWLVLVLLVLCATLIAGLVVCRELRLSEQERQLAVTHPHGLPHAQPAHDPNAIHLGIVPERDIFEQRQRYRALMDYLQTQIQRPIELVTVNTYASILREFDEGSIDGAFLGSMVAKQAMEQQQAVLVLKTEYVGGATTYRGVLFVRDDSPVWSPADLGGRSIGCVMTTTAGELFARYILQREGLNRLPHPPRLRSVGTHDEVVREVAEGRLDAGCAKDQRLDAWEAQTGVKLRRLATSAQVPSNALLLRKLAAEELQPLLGPALLNLHESDAGRAALAAFGAVRFVPCYPQEYDVIDQMTAAGPVPPASE